MFKSTTLFCFLIPTFFSFNTCNDRVNSISYNDAIKSCQPVIRDGVIYSNDDCLDSVPIPEFSIVDIKGNTISNQTIKGKLTLLNFWFIECPPCIGEMPTLHKIDSMFSKKNFEIISICRNSKADVVEFMAKNSMPYKVIPDGKHLLEEVFKNPFGYPANVLIDERGKIINVHQALMEGTSNYDDFIIEVKNNL